MAVILAGVAGFLLPPCGLQGADSDLAGLVASDSNPLSHLSVLDNAFI